MNPGFCEKMEVARVPPGRPSRTASDTRTTGHRWEPLIYVHREQWAAYLGHRSTSVSNESVKNQNCLYRTRTYGQLILSTLTQPRKFGSQFAVLLVCSIQK